MTDRRETPRRPKSHGLRPDRPKPDRLKSGHLKSDRTKAGPSKSGRKPHTRSNMQLKGEPDWSEGERIAKYLARAGVASRREAEAMIERGEIRVNGRKLTSPAFKVTGREDIRAKGKAVRNPDQTRLWLYHKPSGLITTTSDPKGRRTIFDELPKSLPRTMTVGRLDLTTEGLLLLTNDGGLARALELPGTGLMRHYRARAHGEATEVALAELANGITLDTGETYAPITAELDRATGTNSWLNVALAEGKNREIRNAFEHVGLKVNRLIRTSYGPFELGDLRPGAVQEVPAAEIRKHLGGIVPESCLPTPAPKPGSARQRGDRPGKGPKQR